MPGSDTMSLSLSILISIESAAKDRRWLLLPRFHSNSIVEHGRIKSVFPRRDKKE
jgi:hypothetical protein